MACSRKCFTITWRIENYNFFYYPKGNLLSSPLFVIDAVKDTSWKLQIAAISSLDEHISFYVEREELGTSVDIRLNFEISFFSDVNSSPLFEGSYTHTFQRLDQYLRCYVPHNQVYGWNGNELYPPKILTIRCKMFETKEVRQCFARTRFRIERTAFVAVMERFSSLTHEEKRTLTVKSVSTKNPLLTLKLYLAGHLCCKNKLWIEIIPIKNDYVKFCICKLLLFDSEGMKIECGKSEFLFYKTRTQDWKFPLYFTKGNLVGRNAQFLSNDTLTLKCEFAFSTGIEYEQIEDSEFGRIATDDKIQSKFPSALEDMTRLYKEGILCDMELRTETETFNVHKNILSARSSVFKSMFTTDMREKTTDCVIIEDLEADTVRRMLTFLYSDNLKDLDWEHAKSLYFAADKYNIVALKHRCSEFLKSNLKPSDCCDLFLLSDRHQDKELKNAVLEYTAEHHDEILQTDQWMKLEKSNPVLSTEIFRAMYLRNWKN